MRATKICLVSILLSLSGTYLLSCKSKEKEQLKSLDDEISSDAEDSEMSQPNTTSAGAILSGLPEVDNKVVRVVPSMETSFPDINSVHCSNVQYLWDAIKRAADQPIPTSDLLKTFNTSHSWQQSIDTSKLVLAFGHPSYTYKNIIQQYQRKYHIDKIDLSPQGETFWAYTDKLVNYRYTEPFDEQPLQFLGTDVSAFGFLSGPASTYVKDHFRGQFEILYFDYDGEFVVQLKPADTSDEIILVMPNKKETFLKMFNRTQDLIKKGLKQKKEEPYLLSLNAEDELLIPVIRFKTMREYEELKGLKFGSAYFPIAYFEQSIAFNFDRQGVVLESTAASADSVALPQKPKHLNFYKPFYLFIKEAKANYPYFNLWVADERILEKRNLK